MMAHLKIRKKKTIWKKNSQTFNSLDTFLLSYFPSSFLFIIIIIIYNRYQTFSTDFPKFTVLCLAIQ